ncbi:MAG: hypothetical protein K1X44_07105 [Alphaproteobacteria bacterium]|nr:hypothetical protein [Alphaproteobacteria bacterium]
MLNLFKLAICGIIGLISQTAFAANDFCTSGSTALYCEFLGKQFDQQIQGKVSKKFIDNISGNIITRTFDDGGILTYSTETGKSFLSGNFPPKSQSANVAHATIDTMVGGDKTVSSVISGPNSERITYKNGDIKNINYTDSTKTKIDQVSYRIYDGKGGTITIYVSNTGEVTINTTNKPFDPVLVKKIVDAITEGAGYERELNSFAGPFSQKRSETYFMDRTLNDDKSISEKRNEAKQKQKDTPANVR